MTKVCNACHIEKDISEFYAHKSSKDGHQYKCKKCFRENIKRCADLRKPEKAVYMHGYYYQNKNHITEKNRISWLKRAYNITIEQREQMIISQDYKCKSCGIDLRLLDDRKVHLDHNHKTNKIRGILCQACNMSFGILNEDPDRIKKLLDYAIYCKILS